MNRSLATLISGIILATLSACGVSPENREELGDSSDSSKSENEEVGGQLAWNHPEACFECHESSHQSWKDSHHANANRRIDPSQDEAVFASVAQNGPFSFLAEDGRYRIEDASIADEQLARIAATEIDSVIGYEPIWQYLVPFPGGRWQTHAMTWDVEEKEWFNVFGDEERDPGDWGHWTQQGMNWNSNCAFCHMTDFKKNYDYRTHSYSSTWVIEGVSCIQCHAGMEEHVAKAREGDYEAMGEPDLQLAMENCASCHSRREELTLNDFKAGESYHNHFRLTLTDQPGVYFENGLANEEDYVYTSLVLSKMGEKGVTCFDCHDPHTAKTKVPQRDNALCMQCHSTGLKEASIIDEATHSHHAAGTQGASCVDCHMPERTYMGRDPRRDHGFTIPDPQSTIDRGEPNACTGCHDDQSPEWALDRYREWYGESDRWKFQQRRAHALHAAHEYESDGWKELVALYDLATNVYWKTSYMRMMSHYASEAEVLKRAVEAMSSRKPELRDAAVLTLSRRQDRLADLQTALNDPSRLVRLQAANALSAMYDGSKMAFQEWKKYVEMNADRPYGALRRAELALLQRDLPLARQMVRQAISMDRNNPHMRYDGAIVLSRTGDTDEALRMLAEGRKIDPNLPFLAYAQALLYGEKGNLRASVQAFEDAVRLDPQQARWWYNLSIAYMNDGQMEKASDALDRALLISPTDPSYLEWRVGLDRIRAQQAQ